MASGDGGNRHRTWNIQHSRRLAQYNARLERILRQAVTRAASSVTRRNATATADTPFTFKADRVLDSEIDSLMKDLAAEITAVTGGAERTEWDRAQSQAVRYLTDLYDVAEQSKGRQDAFNDTMLTMRSRNLDALDEFQKRKIGGMTLSEKVWDCTADFKGQMECAIDTALLEGKSAASLAQSVQGLLDNPDALFRRVRDAGGTLRLSKAAKAFHPGKGKYRSAHKNAMRLARTEINMAYRASDCNVAQMLDCVVGIRVNLSNNHNCEGVPTGQFTDICDQLAGDYPKDFKFTGWHPQCRCFITYINKTDEEFWRDLENGENNASVNTVKDVPLSFKEWCIDNSQRLEVSKENNKLPYFISDNDKFVKSIMAKKNVVYKSVTRQQVDSLIKEGFLNQDESISIIKMIDDGTPIREIQAKLGNISKGISHSVFEYSQLYLENPNVTKLLNDISKYEGNDEVLRCFLINKLKDECGIMCRKQLERADLTSGLKYDRIVKNRTISKECSFISEGKTIDIPKLKIDGVVFKDDKGYEYIYPIGTTHKNAVANAGRLSVEINKLPQYLKNNVRSVTLTDAINPLDKYWSIVYNNSESEFHSAASCGLDVVFWKYSKNGDISHYIKHELAHNFDNAHNLSLNQLWTDAVDLDVKKAKSPNPAYPTDYAKKNYKEDFAESVAIFLKSKEEFRNKFPYRTEVIELFIKHFPNA